jgi:hypothetical protein
MLVSYREGGLSLIRNQPITVDGGSLFGLLRKDNVQDFRHKFCRPRETFERKCKPIASSP